MIKIALLGSTGSIGRQVLNTVDRHSDMFQIVSLTANTNAQLLEEQIHKYKPLVASLTDSVSASKIKELPSCTSFYYGENSLAHAVVKEADIVFIAVVGYAGLRAVIEAINLKKNIALANKETLVAGGQLVMQMAKQAGVEIIPVDSEHSALFQALSFKKETPFNKLILTASGGAFRDYEKSQIENLKAQEALKHPNWLMGKKITIDCATMVNKGLEVIEALHLYNTTLDKVEAIIHPQSIIHSMVQYDDSTIMAQLSYPSMEIPIQLALTYPNRINTNVPFLDLIDKSLTFKKIDTDKFPCYNLAIESYKMGDNYACAMNSANEEAVKLYLQDKIKFYDINEGIEYALSKMPRLQISLESLEYTDKLARQLVKQKFLGDNN